jgi:D-alanyl-D-alanine carboxypeptidase/D-alanyl-D-alanine-endopeptidase (penicillin-binding protein 4)
MATQTAAQLSLRKRSTVSLYLDASLFPAPTPAPGWTASYLREDVQRVRGLALAGYRGADSRVAVGAILATALKKKGVTATVRGNASTPRRCTDLATSRSAPISRMLTTMLNGSINDYAEFLLRHAARARGFAPTWRGAIDNEVQLLTRAGVPTTGLRVVDGSGLSRVNRMPVATLAGVLRVLRNDPEDAAIVFAWGALPRAGQTGTLAHRFQATQHACARGQVMAKTGTLSDAVALSGVAQGADGKERIFVLLENGLVGKNTAVRSAVDTMATTVVGCRLG